MKYILRLLSVSAVMLFVLASTVFAASPGTATVMDDSFNLSSIRSIAIAMPNYIQTKTGPSIDDVTTALAQSGFDTKALKGVTVIPYQVVAEAIRRDSGTDISTMSRTAAKKAFQQNIGKYADTYLVATIANDSRIVIFYDLYSAKDGKYLYSYEVIGGGQGSNNIRSYKTYNEDFYNGFADSVKGINNVKNVKKN